MSDPTDPGTPFPTIASDTGEVTFRDQHALDQYVRKAAGEHWVVGWRDAMDWLAEYKGAHGIALAEEMSTRLPSRPAVVDEERGDRTHGGNHAPLLNGGLLAPGFCDGCDDERKCRACRILASGIEGSVEPHTCLVPTFSPGRESHE